MNAVVDAVQLAAGWMVAAAVLSLLTAAFIGEGARLRVPARPPRIPAPRARPVPHRGHHRRGHRA